MTKYREDRIKNKFKITDKGEVHVGKPMVKAVCINPGKLDTTAETDVLGFVLI